MGHLMFIGIFIIFLAILFSRVFFGYLFASRKKQNNPLSSVEIPLEGCSYQAKKYLGFFAVVFLLIFLPASIYGSCKLWQKNDPGFWFVVDSIVPVTLIFAGFTIKAFRSHLYIDRGGFRHLGLFRVRRYPAEDIIDVRQDNDFIFVKCRNKRMPVIVENIYGNKDMIYRMLCALKEKDGTFKQGRNV
ncbi:MAG: hypothetical protein ABFD91_03005 [Anaerohalosphaeraceae bacterium]